MGYATAADKQRVKAFIRLGGRLGLYRADDPMKTELADNNDVTTTMTISSAAFLPTDTTYSNSCFLTRYQYNLRNRRHNLSLTVKTDAINFVVRQLFEKIY